MALNRRAVFRLWSDRPKSPTDRRHWIFLCVSAWTPSAPHTVEIWWWLNPHKKLHWSRVNSHYLHWSWANPPAGGTAMNQATRVKSMCSTRFRHTVFLSGPKIPYSSHQPALLEGISGRGFEPSESVSQNAVQPYSRRLPGLVFVILSGFCQAGWIC